MPEGQETPPALALTKTFVPVDLHDREYLKPFLDKPWSPEVGAEVFKKLEGAQSLLGKKLGIPGADAKDDEITKFHEALRPAKADDYELALGEKPDEAFVKSFREAAFEAGASKRTVKVLTEKLTPFFKERAAAAAAETQKMETEYATFAKEAMGEGWDKRQGRVMQAMKELAPEGAKKFIDKLNNNDMALMVATIDAVLSKYAKEDDFKGAEGNGGNGAPDKEALLTELKTLYAHPGWKNFTNPESTKVRKRVEEILASPLLK